MGTFRAKALQNLVSQRAFRSPKPKPDVQNYVDARIIKTGFDPRMFRSNFLLKKLLENSKLEQARELFDEMPRKNVISTNTMIMGYIKSGNLPKARELFNNMVERTEVTWTILIGGYSRCNQFREAFKLFADMCRCEMEVDYVTFASLLSGCADPETADEVLQVHSHIIKSGCDSTLVVSNSLVDSYCKMHRLDLARRFYEEMLQKDSVTFNALITGYVKDGMDEEAIKLFLEMQKLGFKPSEFTFAAVVCAANGLDDTKLGLQLHAHVVKTNFLWNVFVGNALLNFYSKQDMVLECRKLFDVMPELDGVSYNVIITGYARDGQLKECLNLFHELQLTRFERRQFPFATMSSIAANTRDLEIGRQIHAQSVVSSAISEIQVGNSLVDMYAKCNRFYEARIIFVNLPPGSTVPWTAMISAYVQNGLYEEGMSLFGEMRRAKISVDQSTLSSVLRASANLASRSLGEQIHSLVIRSGFMSSVYSGSTLIDVYAKCGSIKNAIKIFREMPERNIVSWNALFSAFAQVGDGVATLKSFEEMVQSGLQPDSISFLAVLTACSHSGLVEEGLQYFCSMNQLYKLVPKREHYASMVDLLCRSGRFDEAEKLVTEMPFDPNEVIWTSILNSCRIHKNQELGKKAAEHLFNMQSLRDGAAYVNMSNIYAAAGQWDSVGMIKKEMRDRGVKKLPAYSWVEIKHKTYIFSSNDKSHPEMKNILKKIDTLAQQMEKEGYKADTSCSLHNVDEETKAESLKYHSERLAIAYALINTPEGMPILVMKNLRACTDCHAAIKVISKIVRRDITVRDSSRFHHFKDGICSCGDYW